MSRCKEIDCRVAISVVPRVIRYESYSLSWVCRGKTVGELVDANTNMNLG
jgi:hypothetical protein